MRKWLLFLWILTSPAWCKTWTRVGTVWKHSNGMTISFPADFLVEESDSILNVTGKQGFINYVVQGMKGDKAYQDWTNGQQKSYLDGGVTLVGKSDQVLRTGLKANFIEGSRTTPQGILFVVVSAAIHQGPDYICLQMYYPKEREQDWTPLFQSTLNSITLAKGVKPLK